METTKRHRIDYWTDPACSWCWGFEPQLLRFRLEYGDRVDFHFRGGGLNPPASHLPEGPPPSPETIRNHWISASLRSGMPVNLHYWDGETPVRSSWPATEALFSIQRNSGSADNAIWGFQRRLRHALFIEARDLSNLDTILDIANSVADLDTSQLEADLSTQRLAATREADQEESQRRQIAYPTLDLVVDGSAPFVLARGCLPYKDLAYSFDAAAGDAPPSDRRTPSLAEDPVWLCGLVEQKGSLTAGEVVVLLDRSRDEAFEWIDRSVATTGAPIERTQWYNGNVWVWNGAKEPT